MRKITILEVWDPLKDEYVPLKQAINQGLFDPQTYLFYSPRDKKSYSITEAARRFMFKSAIDLRPESLIVERVKIAQTVALVSARDPYDTTKIVNIIDAIACGVVDPNLRLYRFLGKSEVVGLSEAIDRDLVQIQVIKEVTEKITETLTEEKSNFGLIKKIQTSSSSENLVPTPSTTNSTSSSKSDKKEETTQEDDLASVHDYDGMFTFDRTKSVNVSKRIKKSDEEFAAGFISDSDSKKIINQTSKRLKSILKSGSTSLNPIIDLNEAIRNNIVILPDSLIMKQNVKYVLDLKTNLRLDYDVACDMGIIDVETRLYLDTLTNQKLNLFEALKKNYIVMREELYTNYDEENYTLNDTTNSKLAKKTRSLSTSSASSFTSVKRKQTYSRDDIKSLFNPVTGEQVPVATAIELGLFDSKTNKYIDFYRQNKSLNLEEAAAKGMAVLKTDKLAHQLNEGYQFLNINGIINPITKQEMKLNEAIHSGILDYTEGEFHDPDSGKTLTLLEAYDRGYLITSVKAFKTPDNSTLNLTKTPSKNEPVQLVQVNQKEHLIDTQNKENIKLRKSLSCLEQKAIKITVPPPPPPVSPSLNDISLSEETKKSSESTTKMIKSHSQSPFRHSKRNASLSSERISGRGKSIDRFSFTSRSSILSKFKDKLFHSRRAKTVQFDANLILDSIRICNKETDEMYDLRTAIDLDLAVPDEKIKDLAQDRYLDVVEAIKQSVIRFVSPNHSSSMYYSYSMNSYIYDQNLYLFNYVLHPNDQRKLSMSEAFERLILDPENAIYFGKKGPYSLESAIQKGYVSAELIDLNLLRNIITSNIFKYSNNTNAIDLELVNNSTSNTNNNDNNNKATTNESDNNYYETDHNYEHYEPVVSFAKADEEEESLPQCLKEKTVIKVLQPLYNEYGYLSKFILQEAGVKFSVRKNYIITEIFDEERNEFLKAREAIRLGIFNEETQEYVNSKTGDIMHVSLAIRKAKIRIANIRKLSEKEFNRLFNDEINEFNRMLATKNVDNSSTSNSQLQSDMNNYNNNNATVLHLSTIDATTNHEYSKIIDIPETSIENLHEKTNNNQNTTRPDDDTAPQQQQQQQSELRANNSSNFDLIQCLLYKKPTNGKYIRFDKVLRNRLYDYESKQIKDLNTSEYISINEALHRGVLRINDADILFDRENVYKIDSICTTGISSARLTLAECLKKKLVSRRECVLKYANRIYAMRDAIREGLVEGRILSDAEIIYTIDEYYIKYEENRKIKEASTTTSKPIIELISVQDKSEPIIDLDYSNRNNNNLSKLNVNLSETNGDNQTSEFYVFDAETEHYVSISDAYQKGLLVVDPLRIKDPTTKSYIFLVDAIVKGLVSCEKSKQKVAFKNRSAFFTINRVSYIIDAIYDPSKLNAYSLQDAIKLGLFKNGLYLYSKDVTYSIDDAISMNLVIGKKIELDKIDACFKENLVFPPLKPQRGIFVEPIRKKSDDSIKNKDNFYKTTNRSATSIRTQEDEPAVKCGKIELVKDIKTGAYLSLKDAIESRIINFNKSLFVNTLTTNTIDIGTAIDRGYIIMDYQAANFVNRPAFETRSRSLSQRSKKTLKPNDTYLKPIDDLNDSDIIKVGRQFIITGVLDPINRVQLELEDAIRVGLFDIDCAMYNDPRVHKKLTLVDAIDQGLVRIADDTFQASYKLAVEEENDKRYYKSLKTYSIRYIVHPITKQIVPLNVAVDRNLINLDTGTYYGYEKMVSLKEAYEKCLALTVDDLDSPDTKRNKYKVAFVRKSTTGKNMSLKSALAKNWLNFSRRVYIDKQTNQEIPFSQAIDMDLLVLLGDFDEKPPVSNITTNTISSINSANKQQKAANSTNRLARKSYDSSNESFKSTLPLRGAASGLKKYNESNSTRLGVYS